MRICLLCLLLLVPAGASARGHLPLATTRAERLPVFPAPPVALDDEPEPPDEPEPDPEPSNPEPAPTRPELPTAPPPATPV